MMELKPDTALAVLEALNELTHEEGDSVLIVADNAGFDGPNSIVDCCGGWTDWEEIRFEGYTMLDALQNAALARRDVPGTSRPPG